MIKTYKTRLRVLALVLSVVLASSGALAAAEIEIEPNGLAMTPAVVSNGTTHGIEIEIEPNGVSVVREVSPDGTTREIEIEIEPNGLVVRWFVISAEGWATVRETVVPTGGPALVRDLELDAYGDLAGLTKAEIEIEPNGFKVAREVLPDGTTRDVEIEIEPNGLVMVRHYMIAADGRAKVLEISISPDSRIAVHTLELEPVTDSAEIEIEPNG